MTCRDCFIHSTMPDGDEGTVQVPVKYIKAHVFTHIHRGREGQKIEAVLNVILGEITLRREDIHSRYSMAATRPGQLVAEPWRGQVIVNSLPRRLHVWYDTVTKYPVCQIVKAIKVCSQDTRVEGQFRS